MATKVDKMKWNLYQYKYQKLLKHGLKNGSIRLYDEELIQKLRNIYYGGIPASIILLSNHLCNGHCYDRATLLSRAFLDTEDDVRLVYASVDSIRLNPEFCDNDDSLYADHCVVERITKDGKHLIYDTSMGFVYDKKIYWAMERPKVRHVNEKDSIIKFIKEDENLCPENIERDKYSSPLILPNIEASCNDETEMYAIKEIGLLQREIGHYKEKINYSGICQEIDEDIKRLVLKK